MATISFSADVPLHHHHHRRDSASSNKSLSGRRPRLLRAYATQPSISTENACTGLLASPIYSTRRAAELLNRVVISSSGSVSPTNASSRSSELPSERLTETNHRSDTACYFSFPSPDTWGEQSQDDKEIEGSP
ncbi:hypothetical protein F4861DRAFT_370723 [Xylaria intraflava]|nr:hypothetical protein F4861DRAFT_370723 [Xylaria intraflava]